MVRSTQLLAVLAAFGLLSVACSKDDNPPAARLSSLGETCKSTGDCGGSLVCRGGNCAESTIGIVPNTKVCELVQCTTAEDCCPTPPSVATCQTLATECEAGTTYYCTQYQTQCVCDKAMNTCTAGQCVSTATCTTDAECTRAGLLHCSTGGKCVACTDASPCTTAGNICVANACVPKCLTKADCPAFYDCSTDNNCTFTGCIEDRECKVDLGSAEAFCNTTTKTCSTKCTNDVACFNTTTPTLVSGSTMDYAYQLCTAGTCQNAGCDTDDECKALLVNRITTTKVTYPHATAQCK